ncbi:hypothetical protein CDAR_117051 [Caerostris darwini]|uniref:Uncharacterized protein n=1 Tax=Caerostris darwini TaxID=1538125 RepID=A0AAV4W8E8_9ARAC|nr:hypothetical protein CDAR_117051 [Caerostris darwini]
MENYEPTNHICYFVIVVFTGDSQNGIHGAMLMAFAWKIYMENYDSTNLADCFEFQLMVLKLWGATHLSNGILGWIIYMENYDPTNLVGYYDFHWWFSNCGVLSTVLC